MDWVTQRVRNIFHRDQALGSPVDKAIAWLKRHELPDGGIRVHHRHRCAYPEVTGYLIPTLLAWGEDALAERCGKWLARIQMPDGSFPDPDQGIPHIFDTGQALRGLLALSPEHSQLLPHAIAAGDYLLAQVNKSSNEFSIQCEPHGIQETIQLYGLPPLRELASQTGNEKYREVADACLQTYLNHEKLLSRASLTHFLAYEIEALIDLGHLQKVQGLLDYFAGVQQSTGSIPAREGVSWVCNPGIAQLAVCWYKVGLHAEADRALHCLNSHQRSSGGFVGSSGQGASYFPRFEPSWAVKYFLDAQWWKKHCDRSPQNLCGSTHV